MLGTPPPLYNSPYHSNPCCTTAYKIGTAHLLPFRQEGPHCWSADHCSERIWFHLMSLAEDGGGLIPWPFASTADCGHAS